MNKRLLLIAAGESSLVYLALLRHCRIVRENGIRLTRLNEKKNYTRYIRRNILRPLPINMMYCMYRRSRNTKLAMDMQRFIEDEYYMPKTIINMF